MDDNRHKLSDVYDYVSSDTTVDFSVDLLEPRDYHHLLVDYDFDLETIRSNSGSSTTRAGESAATTATKGQRAAATTASRT